MSVTTAFTVLYLVLVTLVLCHAFLPERWRDRLAGRTVTCKACDLHFRPSLVLHDVKVTSIAHCPRCDSVELDGMEAQS